MFHFRLFKGIILFDVPVIINHNNVRFGKGTRINSSVFIHAANRVTFGKNVTLSYGATILSTGYNLKNWKINKYSKEHTNKDIYISDNVWIGANSTILSGVKISEGVVVAAGAIVTKDLNCKNALYAGSPARKIKDL